MVKRQGVGRHRYGQQGVVFQIVCQVAVHGRGQLDCAEHRQANSKDGRVNAPREERSRGGRRGRLLQGDGLRQTAEQGLLHALLSDLILLLELH